MLTWVVAVVIASSVAVSTVAIESARFWRVVAARPADEMWDQSCRELARGYAASDLRVARVAIAVGVVALAALMIGGGR